MFTAATLSTIVGLFAFVLPGSTRRVVELSVDVLIVLGCTFVLAWTLRIEPALGDTLRDDALYAAARS